MIVKRCLNSLLILEEVCMVHWKYHVHNSGELNQSQYSFYIWYLSSCVCDVFSKVLCNLLQSPRLDFRLPLKCWMQMAMNKLKRKNSLR